MILPIVAYGDAVLRKDGEEIEQGSDIKKLIEDMFETMYNANGVGLAAPQIGQAIRLFIVDGEPFHDPEDKDSENMMGFKKTFVNPTIEEEWGEEWAFEEGCLSIPDVRADVYRPEFLKIHYFDENWEEHTEEFSGLKARIIQHEYDHIEGILFTDHISSLKKRLLKKKLTNISKGIAHAEYRMRFPDAKKKR